MRHIFCVVLLVRQKIDAGNPVNWDLGNIWRPDPSESWKYWRFNYSYYWHNWNSCRWPDMRYKPVQLCSDCHFQESQSDWRFWRKMRIETLFSHNLLFANQWAKPIKMEKVYFYPCKSYLYFIHHWTGGSLTVTIILEITITITYIFYSHKKDWNR